MVNINNTQECFVQLWLLLERTRRLLGGQCKRFCIRNVLKAWFGIEATDSFIWDVCRQITLLLDENNPVCGNDFLQPPSLYPRIHRELLRTIVSIKLSISIRRVNLKALDKAYSIAFPNSTPINVNKKKETLPGFNGLCTPFGSPVSRGTETLFREGEGGFPSFNG